MIVHDVPPEALARTLGWQEGRLYFDAQPLGEIVAELNHYIPDRIVITDQEGRTFKGYLTRSALHNDVKEDFGGAFTPSGRLIVGSDAEGIYSFVLRDANTLDYCYVESGNSRRAICATLTRECVLADALQRVILDLHALPDDARKMAPAVASRNPSTGFAAAGRNTSQAED